MNIELNDLIKWLEYKALINKAELEDIIWTRNGVPVAIPFGAIEDFRYVGLNNIEFAANILLKEEYDRIFK